MRSPKTKVILKWIKALRSGKYSQSRSQLQTKTGYCCLGVACKIFIPESKQTKFANGLLDGGMPAEQKHAPKWLENVNDIFQDITESVQIVDLNDSMKLTFDEIADVLELIFIHKALK